MIMARIFFSDFLSNDIDRCNTTVNAYRNGDCEIVEGYVKNFAPMPEGEHAQESFDIDGIYFEYSENGHAKPHGGVIRNGTYL